LSLDQDGQTTRLYYHPLSSNSRRVLLTAYHLGLNLELAVVDLSRGEHKTPEYLRSMRGQNQVSERLIGVPRDKNT
jgi:glutathione S-transferase